MQHCRRARPLPQDFIHALSSFGLSPASLLSELDLHVSPRVTQAPVIPQDPNKTSLSFHNAAFVPRTSITNLDRRKYIPSHFPGFPNEHSYQETPVYAARETDALRIRERAMEEGQLAEQALRKLMAAKKGGGNGKRMNRRRRMDGADDRGEEIWREALSAIIAEDTKAHDSAGVQAYAFGIDGSGEEDAMLTAVNYDGRYWRKGKGRLGVTTS